MKGDLITIPEYHTDKVDKPIRTKFDYLFLLFQSIQWMLLFYEYRSWYESNIPDSKRKLLLFIWKMSRLFFFSEDKFFSFYFPFTFSESKFFFNGDIIDQKKIADLLEILNKIDETNIIDSLTYLDYQDYEFGLEEIIKRILTMEDGYIRYDKDLSHINGNIHPAYHYDVYYSSWVSFKLWLNNQILKEDFVSLLDPEKECYFFRE